MARITLIAVGVLAVLVVGGIAFLAVWDIPAPANRVEHAIPEARLPK